MTKRKRDYSRASHEMNSRQRKRLRPRSTDVVFWVVSLTFFFIAFIYVGNKFLTTTKSCTVEKAEVVSVYSNGGRIPYESPVLNVYSEECPTIVFSSPPNDYVSLEQVPGDLEVGHTYEFEVGFFRAELIGVRDEWWRGVGINF